MPAANSIANKLVQAPVVVISMLTLYQVIARLPLYQHRSAKHRQARHSCDIKLNGTFSASTLTAIWSFPGAGSFVYVV